MPSTQEHLLTPAPFQNYSQIIQTACEPSSAKKLEKMTAYFSELSDIEIISLLTSIDANYLLGSLVLQKDWEIIHLILKRITPDLLEDTQSKWVMIDSFISKLYALIQSAINDRGYSTLDYIFTHIIKSGRPFNSVLGEYPYHNLGALLEDSDADVSLKARLLSETTKLTPELILLAERHHIFSDATNKVVLYRYLRHKTPFRSVQPLDTLVKYERFAEFNKLITLFPSDQPDIYNIALFHQLACKKRWGECISVLRNASAIRQYLSNSPTYPSRLLDIASSEKHSLTLIEWLYKNTPARTGRILERDYVNRARIIMHRQAADSLDKFVRVLNDYPKLRSPDFISLAALHHDEFNTYLSQPSLSLRNEKISPDFSVFCVNFGLSLHQLHPDNFEDLLKAPIETLSPSALRKILIRLNYGNDIFVSSCANRTLPIFMMNNNDLLNLHEWLTTILVSCQHRQVILKISSFHAKLTAALSETLDKKGLQERIDALLPPRKLTSIFKESKLISGCKRLKEIILSSQDPKRITSESAVFWHFHQRELLTFSATHQSIPLTLFMMAHLSKANIIDPATLPECTKEIGVSGLPIAYFNCNDLLLLGDSISSENAKLLVVSELNDHLKRIHTLSNPKTGEAFSEAEIKRILANPSIKKAVLSLHDTEQKKQSGTRISDAEKVPYRNTFHKIIAILQKTHQELWSASTDSGRAEFDEKRANKAINDFADFFNFLPTHIIACLDSNSFSLSMRGDALTNFSTLFSEMTYSGCSNMQRRYLQMWKT